MSDHKGSEALCASVIKIIVCLVVLVALLHFALNIVS